MDAIRRQRRETIERMKREQADVTAPEVDHG